MSGSPKYSTVTVAPAYRQREERRRREQQAARRRREEQRARERAELAAKRAREAAARRERARAAAERRKNELAARRAAEQQAHATRLGREQAGADARRLDEVRDLLGRVRASDDGTLTGELRELEQWLLDLRSRIGTTDRLDGPIEELRGRVVLLSRRGDGRERDTDPGAVLAGFERRLAETGPDAAEHDPEGRRYCAELLDRLRATAGPDGRTRFEALLGTVEHALTRHAATVAQRVEDELRRDREAREERRRAEEHAAARAAAEEAAEEAERERLEAEHERRTAVLGEAADRLDVVHRSARDAADEARELADTGLAGRIEEALRAAAAHLEAGAADEALTAVAALEELLPEAEARLDELQLAHTRRMDLGQALQDAMLGEGFAFLGGEDQGERLVLRFERPSGASYETTIATDTGGTPVLVYHVDGEPDVTLEPAPEGAVCDRTEDLLERVHEMVGEQDGFVPGELTWQGKPPSRQAGRLPGAEEWRWTR
ncbi:hypothetical protein ACH5AO_10550 [Streptomyces sp. NPDC018964]|uniref:hypothetical protein n=1 Tax=unclassified Streptomyces TaxID=2593676 RepID=UPI00379D9713